MARTDTTPWFITVCKTATSAIHYSFCTGADYVRHHSDERPSGEGHAGRVRQARRHGGRTWRGTGARTGLARRNGRRRSRRGSPLRGEREGRRGRRRRSARTEDSGVQEETPQGDASNQGASRNLYTRADQGNSSLGIRSNGS